MWTYLYSPYTNVMKPQSHWVCPAAAFSIITTIFPIQVLHTEEAYLRILESILWVSRVWNRYFVHFPEQNIFFKVFGNYGSGLDLMAQQVLQNQVFICKVHLYDSESDALHMTVLWLLWKSEKKFIYIITV